MIRNTLSVLFSSSVLLLPALAQEKAQPAKPPAPAVPAVKPLAAKPNVVAPAAKPFRPASTHAGEIQQLGKRQRQLARELFQLRAKISKEHPELADKMKAIRTEAMELRRQAAALERQARELKSQSNLMIVRGADKLFGEVDPAFAVKNKELADIVDRGAKLRAKDRQEEHARRQEKARLSPGKRKPRPTILPAVPPAPKAGK